MKRVAALLCVSLLALTAAPGRAALTVALAPAVQQSVRGAKLLFRGTLTNTSATEPVFLNDVQFALAGSAAVQLAPETNSFFANVPGILLPGETYTGPLFQTALRAAAPADDFEGTVTFLGGTDIFATSSLAVADFAVLSPAVSLVATDPNASEFGPAPGVVTISRTGRTDLDLPVPFALTGTAVNGATYSLLTSPRVIPSGAATTTITITPILDRVAQGDRMVTLSLGASGLFNPGASVAATVTIHDLPIDAWRVQHFGAAANDPQAGDTADWNGDGVLNLLAYAVDMDPKIFDASLLPAVAEVADHLTLSYIPNPAAVDLQYVVEASRDLLQWSAGEVEPVPDPTPAGRVTFRYKFPLSLPGRAFLHLRVNRPGASP